MGWEGEAPKIEVSAGWEGVAPVVSPITIAPPAPVSQTGPSSLLDALGKRIGTAYEEMTSPVQRNVLAEGPQKLLRVAGEAGGALGDIVMAGGKALYRNIIPEAVQTGISDVGKYLAGSDIGKAQIETLKDLGGLYGTAREQFPESMKNIEAGLNIAGGGAVLKGAAPIKTTIAETIGSRTLKPETIEKVIRAQVKYGFEKGIKPSVVGKRDAAQTAKFYDNATVATKDIVLASPEAIPKTVEEFSQRVRDVKKSLWEKSTGMAVQAGESGAVVDLSPIVKDMRTAAASPNLKRANPGAVQRLNELADAWESQPLKVSPPEAEDLIAQLNAQTRGFWKNPDWNKANDVLFAERAANILRKQTDDAIEAYKGPGWQELRNRYGAQSAIEKEVTHRANVNARQAVRGFFDLTDVFSTGEFVSAIVRLDPASLAKAAAMYSAKKLIKSQNNVDNIISDMFTKVRSHMDKGGLLKTLPSTDDMPIAFPVKKIQPNPYQQGTADTSIPQIRPANPPSPGPSMPPRYSVPYGRRENYPPVSHEQGVTFGVPGVTPTKRTVPNIVPFQEKYNRLKTLPAGNLSTQDWEFIKIYEAAIKGK